MKKIQLVVLICVFFVVNCFGVQRTLSEFPDNLKTPAALAEELTQGKKGDREKCWAIFEWITHNIAYDVESYFNNSYGSQKPGNVLKTGRSVCSGFASLFTEMANAVGIEVVTINGYGKGYGYRTGDSIKKNETNHAWNAVKIDGEWRLIDSTWGGGHVDGNQQYVFNFDPFYFCTPPQQFIYSHFPEDPNWQLLDLPKTLKEFTDLPDVSPSFFQHHIEPVNTSKGCLNAKMQLTLRFRTPETVFLRAYLTDSTGREYRDLTLTQSENDETVVYMNFHQKGKYFLNIFSRQKEEESSAQRQYTSTLAMTYAINVTECDPLLPVFPETTGTFDEEKVQLVQPKNKYLNADNYQTFRVAVPKAIDVCIIQDGKWHHLEKRNGRFEGKIFIKNGSVKLMAQFDNDITYWQLAEYIGR